MIQVFLSLWIISGLLLLLEQRIVRIIIYLGIFSLITSLCFLLMGAPDVAMAEAAISTFSTIFFIVCFEKYYGPKNTISQGGLNADRRSRSLNYNLVKVLKSNKKNFFLLVFTVILFFLFVSNIPQGAANSYLKDQYLSLFSEEVGGENAVTSIYLGYRMYDTLFEALMLLVSVIAVVHLSWYSDITVTNGKRSDVNRSQIGAFTIRSICPVILLFGIYLIMNGHLTPGGGFQGGVALAAFFVCRYLIYDIYDTHAGRIITMEKLAFTAIILLPVLFIFLGAYVYLPQFRNIYLMVMNTLIGMKVTFGFIVIFYRYIAFEKR